MKQQPRGGGNDLILVVRLSKVCFFDAEPRTDEEWGDLALARRP